MTYATKDPYCGMTYSQRVIREEEDRVANSSAAKRAHAALAREMEAHARGEPYFKPPASKAPADA